MTAHAQPTPDWLKRTLDAAKAESDMLPDWLKAAKRTHEDAAALRQVCGEIIACLRANYLRGTLTMQDDTEFEWLLARWEERLRGCGEERVDSPTLVTGTEMPT